MLRRLTARADSVHTALIPGTPVEEIDFNSRWESTPKEQPPSETLRHTDRGGLVLWKAGEGL